MMEEKKLYQKAVAEVILFDNSDVITTSGMDGENTGTTSCLTNVFGVGGGVTPGWN